MTSTSPGSSRWIIHAWRLSSALLLAIAVAVTVYRFAPARIPAAWTADAAELVSDYLGLPVRIGTVDLTWRVTGPIAQVRDLTVLDPSGVREIVHFERGVLDISLIQSIYSWSPVIGAVAVTGFTLYISMDAEGRLALLPDGDSSTAVEPSGGELIAWANRVPDLALSDGTVVIEGLSRDGEPVMLDDVSLGIDNGPDGHRVAFAGDWPGNGSNLRLVAHADPLGETEGVPDARIYVEGSGLNLPAFSALLTGERHVLGEAEVRAWFVVHAGTISELRAEMQAYGLRAPAAPDGAMIEKLDASLYATQEEEWRLSVPDLKIGWAQRRDVTVGPVAARLDRQHGFVVQIAALPVDALHAAVAAFGRVPSGLNASLEEAAPRGEISDLRLAGSAAGDVPVRLSGRLDGLRMDAAGRLPAVAGFDGRFSGMPGELMLELDGGDGVIDLPDVFREPLAFSRAVGRAALRWDDGSWEIEAPDVALETDHIATRARVRVYKLAPGLQPFLDVQAYFEDGDVAQASRYFPVGVMKRKVVDWLDRALVSGRIRSGGFIIRGPVSAAPFRNAEGVFRLLFALEGVVLDYREQWPRAENLDAVVSFLDQGLEVDGEVATLLGTPAGPARATIEDLRSSPLQLEFHADAEAHELLEFVAASPLRATLGAALAPVEFDGRNTLDIALRVPLHSVDPATVVGAVGFDGGRISLPGWEFSVDDVRGNAGFTQSGIDFRDLRARWLGEDLSIDAKRDSNGIHLLARGDINASTLLGFARLPTELAVEGRSPWSVGLTIPTADPRIRIDLSSNLQGTVVNLPMPLGKERDETRDLDLQLDIEQGASSTIRVKYGTVLGAVAELVGVPKTLELRRASVYLGAEEPQLPPDAELVIRGEVATLELQPWQALMRGDRAGPKAPPLRHVDLRIGTLATEIGEVEDVQFTVAPNRWRLVLGGGSASGEISAPRPGGMIKARLRHLDLPSVETDPRNWLAPASVPPLDLSVEELAVQGEALGRLTLRTAALEDGLELVDLSLHGPNIDLTSSGSWVRAENDVAAISGVLQSPDFRRFARALGFELAIDDAAAEVDFDLQWLDALPSPDVETMNGRLGVIVGKGRLSEVDPGVGRVLGLVNLRSLGRRLTLDFSDFLDKGFAFDGMEGHVTIGAGQAHTEDFTIRAPAARIDVQGRAGLVARDYDQLVTVTPGVSGTIPIAAAIAGGPVVGAVALLAEQVVGPSFNTGNKVQYSVTGSWDDPKIERLAAEPVQTQRIPEELIAR